MLKRRHSELADNDNDNKNDISVIVNKTDEKSSDNRPVIRRRRDTKQASKAKSKEPAKKAEKESKEKEKKPAGDKKYSERNKAREKMSI